MEKYGWIIYVILFFLLAIGGFWLAIAAPCNMVDWMAVKDVPARCLN